MVWNEQMLMSEIKKLDEITGLEGSNLMICFVEEDVRTLGAYHHCYGNRFFVFNKIHFTNDEYPVYEALDTVRHEYAHYMNDVIYHESGHGDTWKICCRLIGARPYAIHYKGQSDYFYKQFLKESVYWPQYETYQVGDLIDHPVFGTGIISSISGAVFSRRLNVDFESGESKYLSLKWVDKNCKRIA